MPPWSQASRRSGLLGPCAIRLSVCQKSTAAFPIDVLSFSWQSCATFNFHLLALQASKHARTRTHAPAVRPRLTQHAHTKGLESRWHSDALQKRVLFSTFPPVSVPSLSWQIFGFEHEFKWHKRQRFRTTPPKSWWLQNPWTFVCLPLMNRP